jgi:protein gp37
VSDHSKIQWTTSTWQPVRGCTPASPGCNNCYASRMATRLSGPGKPYTGLAKGGKWTGKVKCCPEELDKPLRWKKPRRIFVCSMGDLFHKDVPFDFIDDVFRAIAKAPQHVYQILTKRPKRMKEYIEDRVEDSSGGHFSDWPWNNVWLGTTIEDQKRADERTPVLLQTPAAVRFVSVEPMLEDVGLVEYLQPMGPMEGLPPLDWVVCGAESGHGARPFDVQWARYLRDQCVDAGVPFFLKAANIDGRLVKMPMLDGRTWKEMPHAVR